MTRPVLHEQDLSPELSESVGFLLSKAAELVTADFEQSLRPYAIRARDYGVLTLLHQRGALSQQRIGEQLRIDRTTMVSVIDDLESTELVTRTRDPADRRRYAVTLTDKGRDLLGGALTEVDREVHDAFLAPLSAAERDALLDMLLRLVARRGDTR